MTKALLIVIMLISGCSVLQPSFTPDPNQILQGKATYVIDGETFYFSYDHGKFKSRLSGIKAPQMTEKGGRESFEYLRSLINQKDIKIEYLDTDDQGRWVVNAFLNDQKIQSLIVENGFAVSIQ